ncbi:high affinity immunoglobulin epsilon receptor subunit beta-like isoform X2 [Lissotriton helveticus]
MAAEPTVLSSAVKMPPEADPRPLPVRDKEGHAPPAHLPRSLQKFYQGEPLALGITQILTGLFQISFGIILQEVGHGVNFGSPALSMNLPVWSGALYTISGILSVVTACCPKTSLVKGGLVLNIICAFAAGVAGVVYLVTIVFHALALILVRCTPQRPKCDTSKHHVYPVVVYQPVPVMENADISFRTSSPSADQKGFCPTNVENGGQHSQELSHNIYL